MQIKVKRVSDFLSYECSGCALCVSICPKKCISIYEDELGFLKPHIDDDACIDCGMCAKKCIITNPEITRKPMETFAAVRTDRYKISLSSSGGVFAAIAEKVQSKGWLVAGSVFDDNLNPVHILTSDTNEIRKMYGSKYVQSDSTYIYEHVNKALAQGTKILFSGTPCQVAAINRYTKKNANLLTIEVICHGVPNTKMFHSFLEKFEIDKIRNFIFRDKGQGWTFNNLITFKNEEKRRINHRLSSYMTYFLEGEIYRESCYKCPYAKSERGADITIGDFWGVVGKRSDLKEKVDIERGVSCLIINTPKGQAIVNMCDIEKYPVEYEDIRDGNEPLNHPSRHTCKRETIMRLWGKALNWKDVDQYWKANDYKLSYSLWSIIPKGLQHRIRLFLGKR